MKNIYQKILSFDYTNIYNIYDNINNITLYDNYSVNDTILQEKNLHYINNRNTPLFKHLEILYRKTNFDQWFSSIVKHPGDFKISVWGGLRHSHKQQYIILCKAILYCVRVFVFLHKARPETTYTNLNLKIWGLLARSGQKPPNPQIWPEVPKSSNFDFSFYFWTCLMQNK